MPYAGANSFEVFGKPLGNCGELGGMHINEVAAYLGLTRARVQQLEMRAIRRLWNEPIKTKLYGKKPHSDTTQHGPT